MIVMEVVADNIVFKNEENGYAIIRAIHGRENITMVGTMAYIVEGNKYKVTGEWVNHPKFGKQFRVDNIEEIVPTTLSGIEKYLASGIITGIGPITAKKIVEFFGTKTLEVLDNDIKRLNEIKGIGKKKIDTIIESYASQRATREIIIFFQKYGISINKAMKIYKKFGWTSIDIVKDNPYILVEYISGIGFKTADMIARSIGIESDSPFRIKSGISYIINEYCAMGSTFMPMGILEEKAINVLGVTIDKIKENIYDLTIEGKIKIEEVDEITAVYNMYYLYMEMSVTKKIAELATTTYEKLEVKLSKEILEFEDENSIKLAPKQREAVEGAINNGIEIITGGPGTGKTTIINCIVHIFEGLGMKVAMAAPTGRAAKRMSEATGMEAKTIHRLLEIGSYSESEEEDLEFESSPVEADVLIIDEASMIDITLMNALLKAVSLTTRIIIVGDVDQLPSVGPGNVLKDLIESEAVKVVRLNEIFRQGQESMIVVNAHLINEGKMPILNRKSGDFYFIDALDQDKILEQIKSLVKTRLPKFNKEWNNVKDIQILSPMRKSSVGVDNLNSELQDILNPKHGSKNEKILGEVIFRVGDKVMQTKNNYNLKWKKRNTEEDGSGVFNGDVGYIIDIDDEGKVVIVFDDDKVVEYEESELEELSLAYAVTIHKSQGSEFPVVIIPMFMGPPLLMNRNLLYTGITRAKKLVVLVGSIRAVDFMKDNNRSFERYSGLKWRIKEIIRM